MTKVAKILLKYTSRSRPDNFFRGLDSFYKNLYDKENFYVICTFDVDDETMNNPTVIEKLNGYKNLKYYFGESKTKVEAINCDIDKFPDDWDILINMSDDMVFTAMFFDRVIRETFKHLSKGYDHVIHLPDQKTKAALITMSIMGRDYFNRFGFIYHPDYISLFCDSEFTDTARLLNKYTYVDISIYNHLHPMWRLAPMDAQYVKTESFYKHDGVTYKKRKARNFDLINYDWYIPIRKIKLSILVCSLWERVVYLGKLIETFEKQLSKRISVDQEQYDGYEIIRFNYEDVEIVCCIDNRKLSIGHKRNMLLEIANGEYEAFFDDDDQPTDIYIEEVMEGINKGVDCCSLVGIITTDNKNPKIFRHYLECEKYDEVNGEYIRHINHLNVVRTSIARQIKFPEKNFSEDTDWAVALKKSGLLKTQHEISKVIYTYKYISNK